MAEAVMAMAKERGWAPGAYEFELLHGVRREMQERRRNAGERVRLCLPFGTDWWPYAVRRVGESARNARLLARALFAAG